MKFLVHITTSDFNFSVDYLYDINNDYIKKDKNLKKLSTEICTLFKKYHKESSFHIKHSIISYTYLITTFPETKYIQNIYLDYDCLRDEIKGLLKINKLELETVILNEINNCITSLNTESTWN